MTTVNIDFKCNGCGACCKFIGYIVKRVKDHHARGVDLPFPFSMYNDFPYDTLENGTCSKLDETNRCTVYKERPAVCNVHTMYNVHYNYMGKEEYLKNSAIACQTLRETVKRINQNDGTINSDMQPSGTREPA